MPKLLSKVLGIQAKLSETLRMEIYYGAGVNGREKNHFFLHCYSQQKKNSPPFFQKTAEKNGREKEYLHSIFCFSVVQNSLSSLHTENL